MYLSAWYSDTPPEDIIASGYYEDGDTIFWTVTQDRHEGDIFSVPYHGEPYAYLFTCHRDDLDQYSDIMLHIIRHGAVQVNDVPAYLLLSSTRLVEYDDPDDLEHGAVICIPITETRVLTLQQVYARRRQEYEDAADRGRFESALEGGLALMFSENR